MTFEQLVNEELMVLAMLHALRADWPKPPRRNASIQKREKFWTESDSYAEKEYDLDRNLRVLTPLRIKTLLDMGL